MRASTNVERVTVDRYFGRRLDEWKALRAAGWDVVVWAEHVPKRVAGRDVWKPTGDVLVLTWRDA